MSNVIIRNFEPNDRPHVRRIYCDLALLGKPVDAMLKDRECAADLLTSYYTDYEPGSCHVAVCGGSIVGCVLASMDNRRFGLAMFWIVAPLALSRAFARGTWFKPDFLRCLWAMILSAPRLLSWRSRSFHSHQGHLHLAVVKDYSGQGIGKRLVAEIVRTAGDLGVSELSASVHEDNTAAQAFFERSGFVQRERYPMVQSRPDGFHKYDSIMFVRKVQSDER